MLTPGESRPSALDQPTRQQLDELDELMQRMLALPVGGGDEPVLASQNNSSTTALPSSEPLAPAVQSELDVGLVPGEPAPAPPIFEEFRFDPPPVRRPVIAREEPSREVEHRIEEETPAPLVAPTVRTTVMIAVWWLQPLLWCNQIYDRCMSQFGPLGSWMRGVRVRTWLGWTGLLLLFGTGAWVAVDWIGWIW